MFTVISIINGDAFNIDISPVDMLFTDPPFELPGAELQRLFSRISFRHLVLICSMHQALEYFKAADGIEFGFDLVVSHITPKKSRSYHQPNMLHSNILYFRKKGVKSAFDRRRVERHDQYGATGYYPSIFHAPKTNLVYQYQKNQSMINDVLGAFDVHSVCDPFAGSGTTGIAMAENGIKDGLLIEKNKDAYIIMRGQLMLLGCINEQ